MQHLQKSGDRAVFAVGRRTEFDHSSGHYIGCKTLKQSPLCLIELPVYYIPARPVRSSTNHLHIVVPKFHSVAGERRFEVDAAKAWNCLTECIRTAHPTNVFKNALKHTYFDLFLLLLHYNCFVNATMPCRIAY